MIATLVLVLSGLLGPDQTPGPVVPWPRGLVVYRFDPSVTSAQRELVGRALSLWRSPAVPLRFQEVPDGWWTSLAWSFGLDSSLLIRVDSSLSSFGKTTLGAGVHRELVFNPLHTSPEWAAADLAHEWGHVLGLTHEHQRWDRDRYIAFPPGFLEALSPERRRDYALNWLDPSEVVPRAYDYRSLMHYSSNIDGNRMVRRDTGALILGAKGPSEGDWARLQRLYSERQKEIP